jgi:hypothetical protein
MRNVRRWLGISILLRASLAHGILLGGAEVPKEKMVVYLMIGHSNMHGMGHRVSDGTPHPRAWNCQWAAGNAWVPAKETPGAARNGLSGRGSGGPSMPFLKRMVEAHPDHHFGVITNASPSSTCKGENTGHNSSDMDPDDNRYWKGARLYKEIMDAAKAVQSQVTFGGIVCMLGSVEATRTPDSVCRSFAADLAQLATDMRADLGLPNLPFIMGEYEAGATGTFSPALPKPSIIDAQIKTLPTVLPYSATVDSRGIEMLDDHHYSTPVGQPEFAKRVADILHAKGWFPTGGNTGIAILPLARKGEARAIRGVTFLPGMNSMVAAHDRGYYLLNGKLKLDARKDAIILP